MTYSESGSPSCNSGIRKLKPVPFRTPQAVTSSTFSTPPLNGSLSLPEICDYHRLFSVDHPLFVYDDESEDFDGQGGEMKQTITWGHAVRAVHTMARLTEGSIRMSDSKKKCTVVAILASLDSFTYWILIIGILRAGYTAFPISPRISAAGVAHLLQQTRARYMFVSDDMAMQSLAAAACDHPSIGGTVGASVDLLRTPSFERLFGQSSEASAPDFIPLPPMTPPAMGDPAIITYSSGSGSTVYPKPFTISHGALIQSGLLPYYGEADMCDEVFFCHTTDLTSAQGPIQISLAMTTGMIISGFSPSNYPLIPSPDRVFETAVKTGVTVLFCLSSFIEAWSTDLERVERLSKFRAVVFAGAAPRKDIGDYLIQRGVPLMPFYGAAETGGTSMFMPKDPHPEGWEYFQFSSHISYKAVPTSDDVHQLFILDAPTYTLNAANTKLNGVRAFDTNDLLTRHPENHELWKLYGRVDVQITHSTGLKTNAMPIESTINRHAMVRSSVMFGRGRKHTGIIIEPTAEFLFDTNDKGVLERYLNSIWPAVEEANERAPNHSRLLKEMVLVADPLKPFEYTSDNTPDRQAILAAYVVEMETAYEAVETPLPSSDAALEIPLTWSETECLKFARSVIQKVTLCPLDDDDDIFHAGCDSLHATLIRSSILSALRRSQKVSTRSIPHNFVYFNPTIRRLGTYLCQVVHYGHASVALSMLSGKISTMERLVQQYGSNFSTHEPRPSSSGEATPTTASFQRCRSDPFIPVQSPLHEEEDFVMTPPPDEIPFASMPNGSAADSGSPSARGDVVLLTGSTGALGSHILESLVLDPSIAKVYALNRRDMRGARSVYIRQSASFKDRDLDFVALNSEKVMLLEGDATEEHLGLHDQDLFEEIRDNITCVIHCAWNVNVNVALSTMEPQLAALRCLIDLALLSPHPTPPRFVFTSALAIFRNWTEGEVAPETFNSRPTTAIGSGYSESKWIAESILVAASQQTPLLPTIVRLGQLCGGRNGSWKPGDWFPNLVRSGQTLQCLPQPQGYISWIPVHHAASALIELRNTSSPFLHLTHPNPIPASPVFQILSDILRVPLVRYSEWLIALEANARSSHSLIDVMMNNPALGLLDFYRSAFRPLQREDSEAFGLAMAATGVVREAAPEAFGELKQLSRIEVEAWVRYWGRIGFLVER